MTDAQFETLKQFGRREAELLDEMEAAVRVGDHNLVWQLAVAIFEIQDQVREQGQ